MSFEFGRKIIGQKSAKEHVQRILDSDRVNHAYLFSGSSGVGKTAFALALAEAINGISNLNDLGEDQFSKKSSWYNHPDIHFFFPRPTKFSANDISERKRLLAENPYNIISFSERPSLDDEESSKNLQAFYPIAYFRDEIRPATKLRPNEGKRVVVILSEVETMRKEAANAFLKLLEEPSDQLMFILTTQNYESLLPTITSRCQHIPLGVLTTNDVKKGLMEVDGMNEEEAQYLARVSGGNYSMTRFFDLEKLKENRERIVEFLRLSFTVDAKKLSTLIQDWQSSNNLQGLLSLVNLIEMFLRDLLIYRETQNPALITNIDQVEVIKNFVTKLENAKIIEMISELEEVKTLMRQNVSPKIIFVVLSMRFANLMRGADPYIKNSEPWNHLPALVN